MQKRQINIRPATTDQENRSVFASSLGNRPLAYPDAPPPSRLLLLFRRFTPPSI